LDSFSKVPKT